VTLAVGARLGPYEILAPIGAGGMGEVYRAHDPRLGRDVAIKISNEKFSDRFSREARAVAALNHPNICHLYDVGPNYLVMELVKGPTLADRIRQDPIPLDEALPIARQIAEALEAAHEKGVVHRDLKPGNIKIRPDGAVKVLDFGLAKVNPIHDPSRDRQGAGDPDNSPTVTMGPTQVGMILGTAAYMSPEQARGKEVDKRADIWAFGCVLYEMVTGKRAFTGENTADILAAVVKTEPDVARAPVKVRRVIEACLQKDPKQRPRDIADAWRLLEDTIPSRAATWGPRAAGRERSNVPWIAAAAVMAIVAVTTSALLWRATRPVDHPLTRLSVDLGPEAMAGTNLTAAISPDGRRLVYPARGPDGRQLLATRLLDQAQLTLLPGTENGSYPFFSPDGQWIGFSVGVQLKKISVHGGAPVTLGNASGTFPMGASWGQDGNIIVGMGVNPLWRIPAAGGPLQQLTKLGPGETAQRWPQVLPGGAILFTASPAGTGQDNAKIEAISLRTGQVKIVQRGGYYGRYLSGGYLVYVRQGVLFGVGFDLARMEVRGAPVPLLEDVAANPVTGGGQFDLSSTGTLVYAAGKATAQLWQVAWMDSSGKMQPLLARPGAYADPRLSPDGTKLAFINGSDIYIQDLERDTTSRLTFTGHAANPVWAPDGKHIVFESIGNSIGFSWVRSDGSGEPQQVLESPNIIVPWSFSPDGRRLAYFERRPDSEFEVWTLPLDITDPDRPKPRKPEPFLRTPADGFLPRFSPDGRWIAYGSNETGNNEIYVRPFPPGNGGKWQISAGGGLFPFWSNNGRELFYEAADNRIMVLDYTVNGATFAAGKPRLWSDRQLFQPARSNLDLAPDGKRFAVFTLPETAPGEKGSVHVTMLLNFFDELKRRIP
jgi:Tol biopolymer transport system component